MNMVVLDQKQRRRINVQIDTDVNASCVPSFCFLRRPRSNETSVTLGTHSALNVSSKYPSSVGGARAAFQGWARDHARRA